jgi:hypothetical protein
MRGDTHINTMRKINVPTNAFSKKVIAAFSICIPPTLPQFNELPIKCVIQFLHI